MYHVEEIQMVMGTAFAIIRKVSILFWISYFLKIKRKLITTFYINQKSIYIHVSLDRLIVAQETGDDEEVAFHIKTHPALKEFPPHYRNGFKLLVRKVQFSLLTF